MAKGQLTAEQKKLDADIGIIAGITLGVFLLYCLSGRQLRSFVLGGGASLPLRLLASAGMQFGLAGLGITVVCILRREPFSSFGLQKAHTIRAIAGTALCFLPYLGYLAVSGQFDGWQPFDLLVADQVFDSGNPWMVLLGMGLVILVWGFFEGFNYAVIAEKIIPWRRSVTTSRAAAKERSFSVTISRRFSAVTGRSAIISVRRTSNPDCAAAAWSVSSSACVNCFSASERRQRRILSRGTSKRCMGRERTISGVSRTFALG